VSVAKKQTTITHTRKVSGKGMARKTSAGAGSVGRRGSVKAVATTLKRNVVRTVNGSRGSAAAGGQTIKIVGDENK